MQYSSQVFSLARATMLYKLKLDKVSGYTTYADMSIKSFLDNNSAGLAVLKWIGILAQDGTYLAIRSIVEYNSFSVNIYLKRALYFRDISAFNQNITILTKRY